LLGLYPRHLLHWRGTALSGKPSLLQDGKDKFKSGQEKGIKIKQLKSAMDYMIFSVMQAK